MIRKAILKDLKFYPDNPRKISGEKFQQLVGSIKEHGYSSLITVNPNNEVIGGNQRLKALREVYGNDYEIDVLEVSLPANKEKKLNIALNGIEGEFEVDLLKKIILDLESQQEPLDNLGFDAYEIGLITEGLIDLNRNPATEKITEIYQSKEREITCPYCNKTFTRTTNIGQKNEYRNNVE